MPLMSFVRSPNNRKAVSISIKIDEPHPKPRYKLNLIVYRSKIVTQKNFFLFKSQFDKSIFCTFMVRKATLLNCVHFLKSLYLWA